VADMRPTHAFLLVAAVAIAAVAGTYAALRTTQLSQASAQPGAVSAASIARQSRALDRAQAALRAELRRRPPRLPSLVRRAAPPPAVTYVRPAPIVRVLHRHGGESEHGDGGELDD
jgi:hypothetical protein